MQHIYVLLFASIACPSLASDITYALNALKPSIVLIGNEIPSNANIVIKHDDLAAVIQINALFVSIKNTSFIISTSSRNYSETQLENTGPAGLRVSNPITLQISGSSSKNFYVSFSTLQSSQNTSDAGLDMYNLMLYNPKRGGFSGFYNMQSSLSAAAMITVINPNYQNAQTLFDISTITVTASCSLHIYAGGYPGYTSSIQYLIITIKSSQYKNFVPSTLSGPFYTFVIDKNCTANFFLTNSNETVQPAATPYSYGFVVSNDYPGSYLTPSIPLSRRIQGQGKSPILITASLFRALLGVNGYLSTSIYENSTFVAGTNYTSLLDKDLANYGHDIVINYAPGLNGSGFLLTYTYGEPLVKYYNIKYSPAMFDSEFSDTKTQQFECENCNIQVNAKSIDSSFGNTTFSDLTQTFSLRDIVTQPRVFKNFVKLSNSYGIQFLASFVALDYVKYNYSDYTIIPVTYANTPVSLNLPAKSTQSFVSIVWMGLLSQFIGNVSVTDGCTVDMYAAGIPYSSTASRTLLYTFDYKTASKFVTSSILGQTFTFVLPPKCGFSASLSTISDSSTTSIPDGGHGFVMSVEYPDNINNLHYFGPMPINQYFSKNVHLNDCRFDVVVPYVDPGNGGNLNVTIYKIIKDSNNNYSPVITYLYLNQLSQNSSMSSSGFQMQLNWSPGTGYLGGYFLKYSIHEVKSAACFNCISVLILWSFMFALGINI